MWTVVTTGEWQVKMSIAVIRYDAVSVALSAKFWPTDSLVQHPAVVPVVGPWSNTTV